MAAIAAVDQLAVEAALVVAQHEEVVAVGICVAQRADLRNVGERVAGVTLRFAPGIKHRAALDRGVGELEQILRRLEVSPHLHYDAFLDGAHQVVAEQRRALPVGGVDVVGDSRHQDHHHADADDRQAIKQRRLPSRVPPPGVCRCRADIRRS
jgi:hypothetical protein